VIRLLAERTVETLVLALQRHKLQSGHTPQQVGAGTSTGAAGEQAGWSMFDTYTGSCTSCKPYRTASFCEGLFLYMVTDNLDCGTLFNMFAGCDGHDDVMQEAEAGAAGSAAGGSGRQGRGRRGGATRGEEEGGEALGALTQELDSRMLFRFFGAKPV
jgi:hypothetical protein